MELPTAMNLEDYQSRLADLSPAGCYVALRVGFYAPEVELNLFAADWVDHYTLSGYALADPLLLWCYQNEGYARWSAVTDPGRSDVLGEYQSFGYRFGSVISIRGTLAMQKRSLGIFARDDREPLEAEMDEINRIIHKLHTYESVQLTQAQLEALRLYSKGYLQKQIAHELNISVSAVKARLRSAADRLEASTLREAALIGANRGIL